ncbi:fused response regulator/phosphatase [Streptomyces sp. NPDC005209]|uniref:fused response regulator/phosphatase n=1 Tax=Streptomyces sp. NPDC005209 TaxID=3156715 RepID=UPI0033AFC055
MDGKGEHTDTTIMVVDDAATGRYALSAVLHRAGHRVVPVASAGEALVELDARLREGVLPDVALVDVGLPDMSGFELCRRVKARPTTAALPVVHFSAAAVGPDDRCRGLDAGGEAYLAMPAEPEEIQAVVRAAVCRSRRRTGAETLVRRLTLLSEATVAVQAARGPWELAEAAAEGAARLTAGPAAVFVVGPDDELYRGTSRQRGGLASPDAAAHAAVARLIAGLTKGPDQVHTAVVPAPLWPAGFFRAGADDAHLVLARTRPGGTPVCVATPAHRAPDIDTLFPRPASAAPDPAGDTPLTGLAPHGAPAGEGLLTGLTSAGTGQAFGTLVTRLAQVTALAAEPLLMYQAERRVARTLQHSFLPRPGDLSLPGMEIVVRYVPACPRAEIGGDFYAALATGAGVLTAVGDVAGHSLDAATVMVEIRHALRAYCVEDSDPGGLAARLDRMLQRHHPDVTATVCLVLISPDSGRALIANAGHIPPLVVPEEGGAAYARADGPLLGLGLERPPPTELYLRPADRLLMITDGLIETRGTDLTASMDSLLGAAAAAPPGVGALCDTLLGHFGHDREDDIAMMALRLADQGPVLG